jgi:hypothetical protein
MMGCTLLLAGALAAADRVSAQPNPAVIRPSTLGATNTPISLVPPTISFGAPQSTAPDLGGRVASPASGGAGAHVVRLQGVSGIQSAAGLPQGARDFLILHARALSQGQVASYLVDLDVANDFFQRHVEPASVHAAATATGDGHTGCDSVSVKCVGEAAKHAEDELKRQAQDVWKSVVGDVARDWNVVADCFSDQNLPVPDVPIRFSKTFGFPITIGTDRRTNTLASVSGTLDLSEPVDVDFTAHIGISYIPCLPYALRPTSIGANGTLEYDERISANMKAGAAFSYTAAVPPGGGGEFPITAIPLLVNNQYVARLDISLYLDGQVAFDSTAGISGTIGAELKHRAQLGFRCSGNGCDLQVVPFEELIGTESVRLEGRMKLRPAILAAVEIAFNGDLLAARAGINPYVQGEIIGCAAGAAKQSTAGGGADQSYALTADFDSGIEALAEAKAGPVQVGSKHWKDDQRHIAFRDLAHSTALQPDVSGKTEAVARQPVALQLKMPSCYPYSEAVEYQLDWAVDGASRDAGRATAASVTKIGGSSGAGCSLGSDSGRCSGDPHKSTLVNLAFPGVGSYPVRVSLIRDAHGRDFSGAPATQHVVTVTGAPAQSAATAATAAGSNGRENLSPASLSGSAASGCCAITPNPALAGRLGRLLVAFPPSAVPSGTRIEVIKDGKELQNGYGNQSWDLFGGTYELKVSGKLVPNVAVQARSDTNVRVGVLSANDQTHWEILDGGTAIANGYGMKLVGLPIGAYSLRVSGQTESFTIRDGQVTDF